MARNDTIDLTAVTWVQLTNANAAAIRVQSTSGYDITLQATSGATAPTSRAGGVILGPRGTLAADLTIAQLWPGVAGANRVWAFAEISQTVSVSHADA